MLNRAGSTNKSLVNTINPNSRHNPDTLQHNKITLSPAQTLEFAQYLSAGMGLEEAATLAKITFHNIPQLFDVLSTNAALLAALNHKIHNEICTTGKDLAWKTTKALMEDAKTPATTRWAAARWTLEASGEGIGSSRNQRKPIKELHEMTNDELRQVVNTAQQVIEGKAVDVTPPLPSPSPDQEAIDALFT